MASVETKQKSIEKKVEKRIDKFFSNRRLWWILIIVNSIILLSILGVYLFRFIKYYRSEQIISSDYNLFETITSDNYLLANTGYIKKEEDRYYYLGSPSNNYLKYSGLIWRIFQINDEGMKAISVDNLRLFTIDNLNYNSSNISKYLNNDFINKLNYVDDYLNNMQYCYENECQDNRIALLTKSEYDLALGKNSMFNSKHAYYLMDTYDNNNLFVDSNGEVTTYQNGYFGVKIVINLKKDVPLVDGDGTQDNPYIIEQDLNKVLGSKGLGEYVLFNKELYRIIDKTDNSVKLLADSLVEGTDKFSFSESNYNFNDGIGKYLNNDFYDKLNNNDYLVNDKFYCGKINDIYSEAVEAKIGLPKIDDLFLDEIDNYLLLTKGNISDNTVYHYTNKIFYLDFVYNKSNLRIVLAMKKDLIINSGRGLFNDPYIIEGEV